MDDNTLICTVVALVVILTIFVVLISTSYYKDICTAAFEKGYVEVQNTGTSGYHWEKRGAQ